VSVAEVIIVTVFRLLFVTVFCFIVPIISFNHPIPVVTREDFDHALFRSPFRSIPPQPQLSSTLFELLTGTILYPPTIQIRPTRVPLLYLFHGQAMYHHA